MGKMEWIELWKEFRVWHDKLVKDGKPPSWRKQQRQIHSLVVKFSGQLTKDLGESAIPGWRPGRPRKIRMDAAPGLHPSIPVPVVETPKVPQQPVATPGSN